MCTLRSILDIPLNSSLQMGHIWVLTPVSFFLLVTLANMAARFVCFVLLLTGTRGISLSGLFLEIFDKSGTDFKALVFVESSLVCGFSAASTGVSTLTQEFTSVLQASSFASSVCRVAGLKKFLIVTGGLRALALHFWLTEVTSSTTTRFAGP